MSRVILFGFDPDTNEPLDGRMVVETIVERDALNPQIKFAGLVTYVTTEDNYYSYDGANWHLLRTLTPEEVVDVSTISSKSSVSATLDDNNFIIALDIDGNVNDLASGNQGPQGERGEKGDQGTTGPIGLTGGTGPQGMIGNTGPAGVQGQTGNTGSEGPRGDGGPQGIQGPQGNAGPQGSAGATGTKGDQGNGGVFTLDIYQSSITTPDTPTGGTYVVSTGVLTPPTGWVDLLPAPGVGETVHESRTTINPNVGFDTQIPTWSAVFTVGSQGPTGPAGPQGDKGDTGDIGPTGAQGIQGLRGFQGVTGDDGATGPKGDPGDTGAQGNTGAAGTDGTDGTNGTDGMDGTNGTDGTNGVGVPTGGTVNQVLAKIDDTDYNTRWVTQSGGGGTDGGAILNAFIKNSDGTLQWNTYDRDDIESFSVSDFADYATLPGGVRYALETNTDTINLLQIIE